MIGKSQGKAEISLDSYLSMDVPHLLSRIFQYGYAKAGVGQLTIYGAGGSNQMKTLILTLLVSCFVPAFSQDGNPGTGRATAGVSASIWDQE